MRYSIVSEIPGRMRLRLLAGYLSEDEARGIETSLCAVMGVRSVSVHVANASLLLCWDARMVSARAEVLAEVDKLDLLGLPTADVSLDQPDSALAREEDRFRLEVGRLIVWSALRRFLLPPTIRSMVTALRALRFVREGLSHLLRGNLTVETLDATAIVACLLRGTFTEADTIMMLLSLSDAMERHVESRARLSLEQGLVARSSHVWLVRDGKDERVPLDAVRVGDLVRLRSGAVVPVDGIVEAGDAELNEASMTGESQLVHKSEGSTVYAGTAVEDGELVVRVSTPPGAARIDAIAAMVERTATLKANSQGKAEALADRLVPAAFVSFFAILAVTRNINKALAVLMVDYSCAIKLSTPICVMSAMREASQQDVVIKGGKYLEALAEADTVVFDKTGTLTQAEPRLAAVVSVGRVSEEGILRLAACIEEHFPHAVARAIVTAASERGLAHEPELHAEVRYVVAHGIAAEVGGKHAVIGSAHFVFEDEGVPLPDGFEERIEEVAPGSGHVYFACDGVLLGALCVEDPLRPRVSSVLDELRATGIEHIVMLTGDSVRAARATALASGIESYRAQVLPEDKAAYVSELEEQGHRVIMVGDGINDSPALAAASVSVALADASDIARTVADVSIRSDSLERLVFARMLSQRLQRRIESRYLFIVGFNTALIVLGVTSLIPLTMAATLHNLSTVAIAASNTRPLMR
jgi:heavy metal translocating P-type ATPase